MRYPKRYGRRRGAKRIKSKKTVVKKALQSRWKQSVAKVCKRVISTRAEVKKQVYAFGIQPQTLQLTTTSLAGNYQVVSPGNNSYLNISQSTSASSNSTRVGNEVYTKKLTMDFTINPNSYNVSTNPNMIPQEVIVYFFKKRPNSNDVMDIVDLGNLYESGSSPIAPTGYLMDCNCKLNSDYFTYLTHRRYKVGRSVVGSAVNLTAPNYNAPTNNDFKWNIIGKINLTKWCPKRILWSDGIANATTPLIHMLVQTVGADGSLQSTSILPIAMFGRIHYEFTDF